MRKYVLLILLLSILSAVIALADTTQTKETQLSVYESGGVSEPLFLYRKPITINNTANSNTLTDYQIKITVDTASLISAGKLRSDCGDIRFTNETSFDSADWTTEYPYWIESGCNTNETVIWVKVDSIPASSTKTIYMYYGNSTALSESNGKNTFIYSKFYENSKLVDVDVNSATGHLFAVGYTLDGDGLIVKFDKDTLTPVARKLYKSGGDISEVRFKSVYVSPDFKYVYAVGWVDTNTNDKDALIVKFNASDLSVIADYKYGGSYEDEFTSVLPYGASYVYAVGRTCSGSSSSTCDALVVKFNSDLSVNDTKVYDGGGEDVFLDVTYHGDYLYAVGYTDTTDNDYDALLTKISVYSLACMDAKRYGGSDADFFTSVIYSNDYLYTAGYTYSEGYGSADALIVKFNASDLSMIRDKVYGSSNFEEFTSVDTDGSYIYAVGYVEKSVSEKNGIIAKINPSDPGLVLTLVAGKEFADSNSNSEKFYGVYVDDYIYTVGYHETNATIMRFIDSLSMKVIYPSELKDLADSTLQLADISLTLTDITLTEQESTLTLSDISLSLQDSTASLSDIYLRKYSEPEPTVSVGIEETLNVVPSLSNPKEPADPSTYSFGASYEFNVTVCDENGAIDISTVLFELDSINHTATAYYDINSTCREYSYTIVGLPAGTHTWRWYANDTSNAWASPISDTFTIAKATPSLHLLLDGKPYNRYVTYPEQTNATAYESNEGDSDVTYCLYRDDTLVSCGSEVQDVTTLSPGTYTYTYNSTEGQNYTSTSISKTLGVLDISAVTVALSDIINTRTLRWVGIPITIAVSDMMNTRLLWWTNIPVTINISDLMSIGTLWWTITPITKTEGEYYQIKCSEWGDSSVRCYTECPECYAEIGEKVRWRKTVVIYNPSPFTYEKVLVNASIPTSTVSESDVKIVTPSGETVNPSEVDVSSGEVIWLVPSIAGGESQTWTIYFNTTPPSLEKSNTTSETKWYLYMNVTGPSDLTYEKVWTYTQTYEPLTLQKLYDYETESYVTTDTNWGPPQPRDTNSDGFYDWYQWITPSVSNKRSIRLEGVKAEVRCNVTSKIIENLPVSPNENVKWKWVVECRNDADIGLNYNWVLRLPLESQYVKVDGTAVEIGFYTLPPAGPYITLTGYLAANSTVNRTVTFVTPPVTVDISPPKFPDKFWVGKNASIVIEIDTKNWASETVNRTKVKINIVYGSDVKLYSDGTLVNETDEVRGYYTFYITNISSYESRSYLLIYKTPVADSEVGRYTRVVLNNTQYLVYPVHTWSLAPFPLDPLYQRFKHEEPFTCDDVAFVWGDLTKETYTNPLTASYYTELDFECEGNETVVELLPLSVGEEEYFAIFVVEEKPMVPILNKIVFDFFEKLVSVVKSIIEAFIGLFSPLMGD